MTVRSIDVTLGTIELSVDELEQLLNAKEQYLKENNLPKTEDNNMAFLKHALLQYLKNQK